MEFVGGDSRRLLLNPEFEGTPLRKDEVLAARTGLDWPGAKEPGETDASANRRRMVPPGVPDPAVWGDRDDAQPAAEPAEVAESAGRWQGPAEAYVSLPEPSHGWIRLIEPACTSCMICARECPSWCITIDSHTEPVEGLPAGARERTRNVLERFAIDWSLCMYCGICVDECPFDALEWVGDVTQPGSSSAALVEEMVEKSEATSRRLLSLSVSSSCRNVPLVNARCAGGQRARAGTGLPTTRRSLGQDRLQSWLVPCSRH